MRNRPKVIIAIAILVATAVAASSTIYGISEGSGGYALWNASEAYFIVEVSDRGYNASGLRYPWILFKEYVIGGFAAVELPDDEGAHLVVIRATPSSVERHILKLDRTEGKGPGTDPDRFTPLEGHIYAYCPSLDGLCRLGRRSLRTGNARRTPSYYAGALRA